MKPGSSEDESRPADGAVRPADTDGVAADAQGPIAEPSRATADSDGEAADSRPAAEEPGRADDGVTADAKGQVADSSEVTADASVSDSAAEPVAESSGGSRAARREKTSDDASTTSASSRPPAALTVVALGAVIVAALAALWFGGGWVRAALFTDGPRADARDSALDAAQQAALNMTTMNLDDVPGSLALARSSMTGPILESATKNQAQSEEMAARAGVGMSSTVLGASITSLNSERDRASALVVLRVTESAPDRPDSAYRYTWSLDMAKDGEVWKAEQVASLTQPVLLDGPGPAGTPAEPGAPVEVPPPTEPTPQEGPR
ncbi:hypothetical protein [Nocardia puris]|uniref:Mce-associated membrane protein n=1 Tax=Nocardia puris TaxID=208602 RepID=A0A366DLJ7_9NOCA|nr:hypothetical protein [Nocardia puris]RBO90815.1 Mce-associated membrane protein [Nocardia puris]